MHTLANMISLVDKFQAHSPEAEKCHTDPLHGRLTMSGNSRMIICGICGTQYPITPEYINAVTGFSGK